MAFPIVIGNLDMLSSPNCVIGDMVFSVLFPL